MRFHPCRSAGLLVAGLLAIFATLASALPAAAASRDLLWEVVSNCLDLTSVDYCGQCRIPRREKACLADGRCDKTLELWRETNNYVALRDRKMCDCPPAFVHGLVIPRARVTGVEDPRRPAGIWQFAWTVARERIGDEAAIALVVNPAHDRSQDQLHVHLVRLRHDARPRLAARALARSANLDEVWSLAQQNAAAAKLKDYGVLVAAHPEGGFLVLVQADSPEDAYTEARCR
jgi:CDP-diacylglycerol pyrophosphatase